MVIWVPTLSSVHSFFLFKMGNCTSLSSVATEAVKTSTHAENGAEEAALLCNSSMVTGSSVSVLLCPVDKQ